MCGIAGAIGPMHAEHLHSIVSQIVESQQPRGPDYQAVHCVNNAFEQVIFGHNRLSILDLSSGANQPLWDEQANYCITFNGEIYNYIALRTELLALGHRFSTASDTEVLLAAYKEWGKGALERLNGMFAFALYDAKQNSVLLARDRFGVKPLYYYQEREALLFASTGAVIADRCSLPVDLNYVMRGLQYGVYDQDESSPYAGLKALKPGCYLTISLTGAWDPRVHSYYDLEHNVSSLAETLEAQSPTDLVSSFSALLAEAVKVRLQADVPVAISLSGGLDSSSIAAMLRPKERADVVGFTFGHPGDGRTEGPLTQKVARYTNVTTHYVYPPISEIISAYFETIKAQDAPFPCGTQIGQYLVYKCARAKGFRVMLSGQGADETLMGYRKFFLFHLQRLCRQHDYISALSLICSLAPTILAEMSEAGSYWCERFRYTRTVGNSTLLRFPPAQPLYLGSDLHMPLWKRQIADVAYASLPTLLRYEDSNSMANSVESRLPFLDYRLLEFCIALPLAMKLHGGRGKWILRRAIKGGIPDEIRMARYKRGFNVRQDMWIQQGLGAAIREALEAKRKCVNEWLPQDSAIQTLFSDTQLCQRHNAFTEATTLLWMADSVSQRAR